MQRIGNILGRSRFAIVMGFAALAVLVVPTSAFAQPANDNFANAIPVGVLPFSVVVDTTGATIEPVEPQACTGQSQTVWYSITPAANETLSADNIGSDSVAEIVVYRLNGPPGIGNLNFVGCSQSPSPAVFRVQAGTTYYIQTSLLFGAPGNLHLNVQTVPPPPNDNFANATSAGPLPYSDTVDATGATTESGEPIPCETFFGPIGTVWYAFTAPVTETVTAETQGFDGSLVAAYSGSSCRTSASSAARVSTAHFRSE
jgi:hypothetical protein